MSQPATPHIPIYGQWCRSTVYDNAQRLQSTPKPTEILYAISFHDNGNTLYHLVSQLHHRWHTSNSYLFLTDGVTVSSPSPFPYTRKTYISRQQTNMAASRLAARPGDARSATLFLGRGHPNIHTVGLSIPPPKNTYGGGAPFPIPTYGHLPIPYLGEAVEPLPIPNLREAVEP